MTWSILDSGSAGFADGNTPGHVYTYPGGAPASGDLLTLSVSSDTTVSTPSGWTLGPSDVHSIGAYLFYRIAGASEPSSVTIITSGNFPTAIGYLRYSGQAASSPADVQASAFATSSNTVTPTATTAALNTTGELVVAAACLGNMQGGTPAVSSWTAGYTNRLSQQTAGTGTIDQHLFVADNYTAGTAAASVALTFTGGSGSQTMLVIAFKPATGATATKAPQTISQYGSYF